MGELGPALAGNGEGMRALAQVHSPRRLAQLQIHRAELLVRLKRAGEAMPLIERARRSRWRPICRCRLSLHRVTAEALAALGRYQSAFEEGEQEQAAQLSRTDQLVARQLAGATRAARKRVAHA